MTDPAGRFWRIADALMDDPGVDRGTLMRFDCLRVDGQFAAAPHHRDGSLVVKLSAERVATLIGDGVGEPFAPAGRVFREWALVRGGDDALWRELISEAVAFARG